AAMVVETEEVKEPWERLGRIDYTDLSTLNPCRGVTVTPTTVTTPTVALPTRKVPALAPTPTMVKPVVTTANLPHPHTGWPDSGEPKAMSLDAIETGALLPDSGEPKAVLPGDGQTEAVLLDSREPMAMLLGDGETEVATAPPQLSNGKEQRLTLPTLRFEQEKWDPLDVLVLSSKLLPQLEVAPTSTFITSNVGITLDVNFLSLETRFDEPSVVSVEEQSTLFPATEGLKAVPPDVSVERPSTLVPTAGRAAARTSHAGTTVSRSSDANSFQARHLWGYHDFPSQEKRSRFSGLNLPLPRPPPEPVYATWRFYQSRLTNGLQFFLYYLYCVLLCCTFS
ncbi:MAG: hypothetical protein GY703_24660, partial [Gammaproteobacteria bacterium]|nr:hypothetical protein [Gammaproteobacteria bacterium]